MRLHSHDLAQLLIVKDIPSCADRTCHIGSTRIAPFQSRTWIANVFSSLQEVWILAVLAVCAIDARQAADHLCTGYADGSSIHVVAMIARLASSAIDTVRAALQWELALDTGTSRSVEIVGGFAL